MKSSSVNREVLGFEGFLRGFREVSEGVSGFSGVSGSFWGFPGFSTTRSSDSTLHLHNLAFINLQQNISR
jgi:hypothetical protein